MVSTIKYTKVNFFIQSFPYNLVLMIESSSLRVLAEVIILFDLISMPCHRPENWVSMMSSCPWIVHSAHWFANPCPRQIAELSFFNFSIMCSSMRRRLTPPPYCSLMFALWLRLERVATLAHRPSVDRHAFRANTCLLQFLFGATD